MTCRKNVHGQAVIPLWSAPAWPLVAGLCFGLVVGLAGAPVYSEETTTRSFVINFPLLPGASAQQEVVYSPSEAEFEQAFNRHLEWLRTDDPRGRVNPSDGPTMTTQTTWEAEHPFDYLLRLLTLGLFEFREGRTTEQTFTAAEYALYVFVEEGGSFP